MARCGTVTVRNPKGGGLVVVNVENVERYTSKGYSVVKENPVEPGAPTTIVAPDAEADEAEADVIATIGTSDAEPTGDAPPKKRGRR